jgi:catechol 2,3-dioxygenase-like lactoylglutathione lyase family enzyme
MPVTVGINHVTTTTTDVDRMVRFYSEMFDAEKVFEGPAVDGYPRMAIVGLGAERYVKVVEDAAEPAVPAPNTGVTERFGLAVDSFATLRELRERMLAAGAVLGEIERLPTQWVLAFTDPDGTPLQVCAHALPDDVAV